MLIGLRLGDRLTAVEHIDPDALDCPIPSLTLQPLVENAIKYGIAPRARGGCLEIDASFDAESLVLQVRDDGPGAPAGRFVVGEQSCMRGISLAELAVGHAAFPYFTSWIAIEEI